MSGNQTMTAAEFRELHGPGAKTRSKYGNRRATYRGQVYHSKGEAKRAEVLDALVAAGDLLDWIGQPLVRLGPSGIGYRADFFVVPAPGRGMSAGDLPWYEDFKGAETQRFRDVKKLWAAHGRLPLRVVKSSGRGFVVSETIEGGGKP